MHFEVGVTPKVRTTETADAFIRSLVELQLKSNAGNASHQEQQQQFSQEQLSAGVEGNVQRERERRERGGKDFNLIISTQRSSDGSSTRWRRSPS